MSNDLENLRRVIRLIEEMDTYFTKLKPSPCEAKAASTHPEAAPSAALSTPAYPSSGSRGTGMRR